MLMDSIASFLLTCNVFDILTILSCGMGSVFGMDMAIETFRMGNKG